MHGRPYFPNRDMTEIKLKAENLKKSTLSIYIEKCDGRQRIKRHADGTSDYITR